MTTSKRWRRRLGRVALGLGVLLLAGAILEQVGAWRDLRRFPPAGNLVDLGDGRRMYLDCRGSGSPTVLLEAGYLNWSPTWTLVQPEVAKLTRVCSYDRAGLGSSDPGPRPRVVTEVNADLERLLARAGVAPPFVLVGHSAGGMYQRLFTVAHREGVVGMVQIDSNQPTDEADRLSVVNAEDERRTGAVLTALVYSGVFRFVVQVLGIEVGGPESARYPEEARVRMRARMTRLARSMNDEWVLYRSAYATVPNDPLGALPLVVIAAFGYRPEEADRADWRARQTALAGLSTKGRLVVLEHQAHLVPLLEPDVVVTAIREVVEAARAPSMEPAR